jgi:hypothetical protein
MDIKQLLTAFERYAYGQSLHTAFTELLDWALLPFKKFDSADEQLKVFETFRNHPKVGQLTSLITLIGDLSEGFSDPIGKLYMQAIPNGHNGQYFTPESICSMMANMPQVLGNRKTGTFLKWSAAFPSAPHPERSSTQSPHLKRPGQGTPKEPVIYFYKSDFSYPWAFACPPLKQFKPYYGNKANSQACCQLKRVKRLEPKEIC